MRKLSKDELIEKLEEIEYWPELVLDLDSYLGSYIYVKDVDMVKKLLLAGANPNPDDSGHCYLFHLLHEYHANRTLKGAVVLEIIELLLQFGADPNRVWGCNLRAYDMCDVPAIEQLLEKYGADPTPREAI